MIFVTVGTQLPFDRMVRAVDDWAGRTARTDVFAQIGPSDFRPAHLTASPSIDPAEFNRCCRESSVIIAHAGMGSILTALEFGKPIIIMPRLARLREQRNDHQVATCQRFRCTPGIHVAEDDLALARTLERIDTLESGERIGPWASDRLLRTLSAFIRGDAEQDPASTPDLERGSSC